MWACFLKSVVDISCIGLAGSCLFSVASRILGVCNRQIFTLKLSNSEVSFISITLIRPLLKNELFDVLYPAFFKVGRNF